MNDSAAASRELVLIHAPFGRDGALTQEVLTQAGIQSRVCLTMAELKAQIPGDVGAAIIGDEALSSSIVESLAADLGQQPPWSDFPLLIMTTSGGETQASRRRLQMLEPLGNVTLLERPLRKATLISTVRSALRARVRQYQIRDHIAQRERDEAILRESEARYRTLAEAVPQLVWTGLPDGSCDYLSTQWVEYTGIPESDQLGLKWLDVVMHPGDRSRTFEAWMDAVENRAPYDVEYRLRRHDGVYRWFKTRATAMRDSSGAIVKWFGTCTDIDDRKRAEEERRALLQREQTARRTAELLNRIGPLLSMELDTQKLAEKVTDLATQLTGAEFGALFHNVANEHGESYMLYTLSGVPREAFAKFPMPRNTAVFGRTFRNEGIVRSDDITKDPRYGKNAPYHGMPEGHLPVRSYLAASVVSRSGEVLGGLFFGHSSTAVFTEDEEAIVSGIAAQAAIALDNARLFSESRRAQAVIQRANEELRQANAELEQFAYSASHDLQEPLRMVAIYSQMLKKKYGGKLDANADQYIAYTVQGANRMEQLVNDLLLYSQSTAMAQLPHTAIDANDALHRAIDNLRTAIDATGAVINCDVLPEIKIREVHLQQLFQNLLGNALKYHGKATPFITVSVQRQPGAWLFSVADNGIGIDKRYAEQIFGIFKRLHGAGEYSGTGIGLAICRKIIDRYGGRIWVESELGKGATFFFSIPDPPPPGETG
jgi:PAS domain S-box-containing protein